MTVHTQPWPLLYALWRRIPRAVGRPLTLLAWLLIAFGFIALLVCYDSVIALLSNGAYLDGLPNAQVTPRDAAIAIGKITAKCAGVSSGGESDARLRAKSVKFAGSFDIYYHTEIDRTRFGWSSYVLGPSGASPAEKSLAEGFAQCLSEKAFSEMPLTLVAPRRLDSRILWIYVMVERGGMADFIVWPDARIPPTFNPWERPWVQQAVEAADGYRTLAPTELGTLFETWPFLDAFTREQIISLPIFLRSGDLEITAVVDVQAGSTPSIYARMVCLNLVISLAILCLSAMLTRRVDSYFLKTFYRAWLVMSLLYTVEACSYFSVGLHGWRIPDSLANGAVPVLSVINNLFFLLTAFVLRSPREVRKHRLVVSVCGSVILGAVLWAKGVDASIAGLPVSEGIESIFSAVVLCIMGFSLVMVFLDCAESLQKRDGALVASRSKIRWTPVGAGMIALFFLVYAGLQLSIPFWLKKPSLEEFFLFTSVPMKVGFASIFCVVVLVELYWEKFKANSLFFETSGHGVIEVDSSYKILSVNSQAAELINLSPATLKGKHLNQVLFRSLVEAEQVYGELAQDRPVQKTLVRAKTFPRGDASVDDIEEVTVRLQAHITGRGLAGRPRAVFLVSRAAKMVRTE